MPIIHIFINQYLYLLVFISIIRTYWYIGIFNFTSLFFPLSLLLMLPRPHIPNPLPSESPCPAV